MTFLIQCLLRRGGLHICQQNCALIVQSDLDYWGLDDIHLQVLQPGPQKETSNSKKLLALSHCHVTGRDSTYKYYKYMVCSHCESKIKYLHLLAAVLHKQILPTHRIGTTRNRGGGDNNRNNPDVRIIKDVNDRHNPK